MNLTNCSYCGSQQIESYKHLGELVCQDCGAVLQENAVLEDVQYSETPAGNTTLVGQFIPTAGSRRLTLAYGSWQSREQVIKRGYHNIQRIADYLHLSSEHVESAQRIYLLAVQRNFTMGRNNLHVASCCLYTICRREKTPHLLIDFSDILQTPVKTIGQIFMKLVRMLHISVPNVDPSIFFERFATQLHLKNNIQKIITTGVRIIQAMNRDWLCTGRRPTGLCGAALIVAARLHDISLSAEAVASVVRISHPTIMKRLSEFKETCTAQLKASEFDKVDLDTLPNVKLPPCLISKLKKQYDIDTLSDLSKDNTTYESSSNSPRYYSTHTPTFSELHINDDHNLQSTPNNGHITPPEVTTLSSTSRGGSSNYLPVNGIATPRDRGGSVSSDVTSSGSGLPESDLRELEGELNRGAVCKTTSGGMTSGEKDGMTDTLGSIIDGRLLDLGLPSEVLCKDEPSADDIKGIASSIMEKFAEVTVEEEEVLSSDDEEDLMVFNEMILKEDDRKMKMILWDEITKDVMPKVWRRQMERKRQESEQNVKKEIL